MIRVEHLGLRILAQIIVIVTPLMLVLIYQAVSDGRRAAAVESVVTARDLSREVTEEFASFVTYATDAVDLGTLGPSATAALHRSLAAVEALHGRDPRAAGVTNALHGLAEHVSVAMPVKELLALQPRIQAIRGALAAMDAGYERESAWTVRRSIESARRQGHVVVAATTLTLLVAAWFVYGMIMGVTGPLNAAVALAGRIAAGDLASADADAGGRDLGNLLASLRRMRGTLHEARMQADQEHRRLALREGELSSELQMRTRELQRAQVELQMLHSVGQAVGSSTTLDAMLSSIVDCARQVAEADSCTLYEFDPGTQVFVPRLSSGLQPGVLAAVHALRLGLEGNPVGGCASSRMPLQVTDEHVLAQDGAKGAIWLDAGYRSGVAVPLVRGERIIGAFMCRRCKPAPFNRSLLQMLQTVAAQSVLAIDSFRSPGGSVAQG
mgnify:CR=1 FL=1